MFARTVPVHAPATCRITLKSMRILMIGGTGFLGRHLASEVLRRGHALTLFTRGKTNPDLFPEADHLRGDRTAADLEALTGRSFDAVIDTCGYFPKHVDATASALRDTTGHYTFISSLAVYPDPVSPGADEEAPVATLEGAIPETIEDADAYGALKALCEQAAEHAMPGRVLSIRPGLLIGPYDATDRFAYWPRRIAEGGRVLAAEPNQPVQLIDARDLAIWIVDSVERDCTGVYNTTGPAEALTMAGLVKACRAVAAAGVEVLWAGDRFLREHDVEPWEELPLWLPAGLAGFLQIDCSKAIGKGLQFRRLEESIRDTLKWEASRSAGARVERLLRKRERDLLDALDRQTVAPP